MAAAVASDRRRERQARQAAAVEKIKKSKTSKKRKQDDDASDSDNIASAIHKARSAPLPGQMENCAICDARFTVTPYSRAGPDGGLLCNKCGRELAKDDDAPKKKKPKITPKGKGRRQAASRRLDGVTGCKSLMTLCTEVLSRNIHLAEDIAGYLPDKLIDGVARQLSKRRLMNAVNLNLFLHSGLENVAIYDAAKLSPADFMGIFQRAPNLQHLKAKNAIQFQDEVLEYLITRNMNLKSIYLHGASLLSEDCWLKYLKAKGKHLESLRVYYTDRHVGDDMVAVLPDLCPSLKRLKIAHNQKVTDEGIKRLAALEGLEHLGIQLVNPTSTEPYTTMLKGIGKSLQTLSLAGPSLADLDDRVLDAIHEECHSLSKLRITDSQVMTDTGFVRLFKDWANKPLRFVDFEKCRHMDSAKPRENAHLVGFCSGAFRALMAHSGKALEHVNVHACRHIKADAFEHVFSEANVYPELQYLEISFCEDVTDFIVGSIFRSCPNLKKLNVFGCMKLKDVRVPKGKILVGMPNAMGMEIEGNDD